MADVLHQLQLAVAKSLHLAVADAQLDTQHQLADAKLLVAVAAKQTN